jgi:VWFA-related protein
MRTNFKWLTLVAIAISCLTVCARGQAQTQPDDVVRVNTELVQTDVMVLDRRGRFVDGLKPEQFLLTLNGDPKQVTFLELFGSAAANQPPPSSLAKDAMVANARAASTQGRVIFFFVDDVHLSSESLTRARNTLSRFIDHRINEDDRVAIVSTSGQIGFLQQLSDDPAVWREAISRLNYRQNLEGYAGKTRISEYTASRVAEGGDRRLFAYLMESVKVEYGMGLGSLRGDHSNDSAGQARRLLQSRISQINTQSKAATSDTLTVFQSLIDSSAAIPGRKLVFFLSDGFVTDPRSTNALERLREATRLAAKSGAVVYSVDMRGSFLDAAVDAANNDYVDMTSRHGGVGMGEVMEPRQPLNLLADETGGRMLVRSNDLDKDLDEAVAETSSYYLLAWRPTSDLERNGKARLEVKIADRPDLKVRLRRAYYVPASIATSTVPKEKVDPDVQLLRTLGSVQPVRTLPTSISVGYVRNADSSLALQASMEIPRAAFTFDEGKQSIVDVVGAAIDDRGLIYTFKQVLTAKPAPADEATLPVIWHQTLAVKPGLYQVRLAVRERNTGRTGSAMQWIDLKGANLDRLSMSSVFLGERRSPVANAPANEPQSIPVEADHSFARNSVLRFQAYLYGAAQTSGESDVWVDARLLRAGRPVLTISPNKVPALARDASRLPYWSEISLAKLSPGPYTLEISAFDRIAGSTTTQRVRFLVE